RGDATGADCRGALTRWTAPLRAQAPWMAAPSFKNPSPPLAGERVAGGRVRGPAASTPGVVFKPGPLPPALSPLAGRGWMARRRRRPVGGTPSGPLPASGERVDVASASPPPVSPAGGGAGGRRRVRGRRPRRGERGRDLIAGH